MAPDLLALVAGVRIPYPKRSVVRARNDTFAIARYGHGRDRAIMPGELGLHFQCLDVPDPRDLVVGTGDEALAVGRHGDRVDDICPAHVKRPVGACEDVPDMSLPVLEKANDTEWLGHCAQSRDGALMALEHDRLRGLVGIPDAHFPVVAARDEFVPIRREGEAADMAPMPFKDSCYLIRFHIPQVDEIL